MRLSELRADLTKECNTEFVAGVYPRRQLTMIASPAGLGKTWLILQQSLDMCRGSGVFLAGETEPLKVVLFCGETGASIVKERLSLLGCEVPPENLAVYTYAAFSAAGVSICLDEQEGMSNFAAIVEGEQPDVVFIDTLISFRNDDENASTETASLLGKLRAVADKNNCAVVIMHHVRKRKLRDRYAAASQDEVIGTSAFTRLTACVFMLSEQVYSRAVKFSCVKSWFEKPEEKAFTIDNVDKLRVFLVPVLAVSSDKKGDMGIEVLRKLPQWANVDRKLIRDTLQCSDETARTILQEARELGIVDMFYEDPKTHKQYFRRT